MSIAVVADGDPAAGLGHLARCSAIAAALRARGLTVSCHAHRATQPRTIDGIAWEPLRDAPAADVVVLDTYTMSAAERAALAKGRSLAVMHDRDDVPAGTALVVSAGGAVGSDSGGGPVRLVGLRYAPLRAPFWGVPAREVRERVERVLVTTGGGALQDAGVAQAAAIKAALPDVTVALVRGPYARFDAPSGVELVDAPPSLLAELLKADVVVTAAGQSALEAAATGAATVAIALADNQRGNAARLAEAGAARVIGASEDPAEAVTALAADGAARVALAACGQAAVDGFGALRIAYHLATLDPF